MRVRIDKSFEKDTNKISDRKLLHKVAECIQQVMQCNSPQEIQNLKSYGDLEITTG